MTENLWEFIVVSESTCPIAWKTFSTDFEGTFETALEVIEEKLQTFVQDEETRAAVLSGFSANKAKLKNGGFLRDPCSDVVFLYVSRLSVTLKSEVVNIWEPDVDEVTMSKKDATKISDLQNGKRKRAK